MALAKLRCSSHFYPRPPRGGRRQRACGLYPQAIFLSTPSARRATATAKEPDAGGKISIHALREEGDRPARGRTPRRTYFYPRPPRGGRRPSGESTMLIDAFLSTPSARRATHHVGGAVLTLEISIHALREEGDTTPATSTPMALYFYPRPPRGGRPGCSSTGSRSANFYPRPPRGGRLAGPNPDRHLRDFYPRPPRGGRPNTLTIGSEAWLFLSTPSARRATRCPPSGCRS